MAVGRLHRPPRSAEGRHWPETRFVKGSPDPEPSRAGLFGGHHVRKWLPAKHRRPQARKVMPGPARRNACKMLVESSCLTILMPDQGSQSTLECVKRFASVS